jgi:hypothetical protein
MTSTDDTEASSENQLPNHELCSWQKSVGSDPKTRPDGGSTSIYALAFSTLLSSQETDAHRRFRSRFPVGATLKLYPRESFVSTSCPEAFRKVADCRILRPPSSGLQRLRTGARWLRKQAAWWLPGSRSAWRLRLRSVPSPSGQEEPYARREPSSNRELYPGDTPSLTRTFRIWYGCDD